jgi:DNA-binding MarR family transcriptional regulator
MAELTSSKSGLAEEALKELDALLSRAREIAGELPPSVVAEDDPAARDEIAAGVARALLRARRAREQFFDATLFADPMWDALLELYAAEAKGQPLSVTSFCAASGAPASSALRYLKNMIDRGLLEKHDDQSDNRRVFVRLSRQASKAMTEYLLKARGMLLHPGS